MVIPGKGAGTGRDINTFGETGNALILDLGADYVGAFTFGKFTDLYVRICVFMSYLQ